MAINERSSERTDNDLRLANMENGPFAIVLIILLERSLRGRTKKKKNMFMFARKERKKDNFDFMFWF